MRPGCGAGEHGGRPRSTCPVSLVPSSRAMPSSRTISDARGQQVPVYSLQNHWQSPELPAPVFRSIRARFINTGFLGLGLPAWMLWLLVALHLALAAAVVFASTLLITIAGVALGATYLAYWITHRNQVPTPDPRALAEALLEHRRCPSCAYPLNQADPGDPVTCSECGAVWILPLRGEAATIRAHP